MLCSWTFLTRVSLKNINGWFKEHLFLEKATSAVCFVVLGLKDILYFRAQRFTKFKL